jgi:RP/EB family microtubule-associated protein
LGAGSVYCQVLDVIHPGTVSINKVNWKAKNDYEFIANLKILQNGFTKSGIKKHLEVGKLLFRLKSWPGQSIKTTWK